MKKLRLSLDVKAEPYLGKYGCWQFTKQLKKELTEEKTGDGESCSEGVDCDRLVGEEARDCDLLPGFEVDRVCVIKIIIINDNVDVEDGRLVGYASQDCDLLPGIKDAF